MANHYPSLNPEKALIWRIVHRDNLPWILDNGLHCGNSAVKAPDWVNIGNPELIDKRANHPVPLPPGGLLATFSCSGLISADLFQKVLFGAAVDASRQVQIIQTLTQGPDHPVLLTFPESAYLKGFLCRVW